MVIHKDINKYEIALKWFIKLRIYNDKLTTEEVGLWSCGLHLLDCNYIEIHNQFI